MLRPRRTWEQAPVAGPTSTVAQIPMQYDQLAIQTLRSAAHDNATYRCRRIRDKVPRHDIVRTVQHNIVRGDQCTRIRGTQ